MNILRRLKLPAAMTMIVLSGCTATSAQTTPTPDAGIASLNPIAIPSDFADFLTLQQPHLQPVAFAESSSLRLLISLGSGSCRVTFTDEGHSPKSFVVAAPTGNTPSSSEEMLPAKAAAALGPAQISSAVTSMGTLTLLCAAHGAAIVINADTGPFHETGSAAEKRIRLGGGTESLIVAGPTDIITAALA